MGTPRRKPPPKTITDKNGITIPFKPQIPKIGTVMYRLNGHKKLQLVYVEDGQYMGEFNRITNFWSWRKVNEDGTLGRLQHGYGKGFFKYPKRKKVTIKVEI